MNITFFTVINTMGSLTYDHLKKTVRERFLITLKYLHVMCVT